MSSWEADPDDFMNEPTHSGGARTSYTEGRYQDRGFAVTIESSVDVSNFVLPLIKLLILIF